MKRNFENAFAGDFMDGLNAPSFSLEPNFYSRRPKASLSSGEKLVEVAKEASEIAQDLGSREDVALGKKLDDISKTVSELSIKVDGLPDHKGFVAFVVIILGTLLAVFGLPN